MYIKKYNSFNRGYNMTIGGRGVKGLKHSEETKKKLSIANEWCKGENHPFYGKTHNEEARAIFRNNRNKQWIDSEGNVSSWNKGIPMREESRKKLSEINKGKKPGNCKKVDMYDLNGIYVRTFDSITDVARYFNILSLKGITSVLEGRKKSHLNHIFKFNKSSSTIESTFNNGWIQSRYAKIQI